MKCIYEMQLIHSSIRGLIISVKQKYDVLENKAWWYKNSLHTHTPTHTHMDCRRKWGNATHFNMLAWTEESGELQSMRSHNSHTWLRN